MKSFPCLFLASGGSLPLFRIPCLVDTSLQSSIFTQCFPYLSLPSYDYLLIRTRVKLMDRLLCLSMGVPKQEYWSGLQFPSPGDLLNPGIELASPALAGGFFTTKSPGKPEHTVAGEQRGYRTRKIWNQCFTFSKQVKKQERKVSFWSLIENKLRVPHSDRL